jgi:MoxR-like ATPase
VKLVTATRTPRIVGQSSLDPLISFGASPRASINLILAARALAFVRGRDYTLPQEVQDLALDVIRHRLVLSYEALADNISPDELLNQIINAVPVPEVPLHERKRVFAG